MRIRYWWRDWQDRHPNAVPVIGTLFGFAFIVLGMWAWTQNMARDAQTARDLQACLAATPPSAALQEDQ